MDPVIYYINYNKDYVGFLYILVVEISRITYRWWHHWLFMPLMFLPEMTSEQIHPLGQQAYMKYINYRDFHLLRSKHSNTPQTWSCPYMKEFKIFCKIKKSIKMLLITPLQNCAILSKYSFFINLILPVPIAMFDTL